MTKPSRDGVDEAMISKPDAMRGPALEARVAELFAASQNRRAAKTDRAMVPILFVEWIVALTLAYEIAPRAWPAASGPNAWQISISPVSLALLGLVPLGATAVLALLSPGRPTTRFVAVTTQLFLGGIVLGFCHGAYLCELAIYGSIVGLSFYGDYGVLVLSSVFAAVGLGVSSTYGYWSLPLAWGYLGALSLLGFGMTTVSRQQTRTNAERKAKLELRERQREQILQTLHAAGRALEQTVHRLLTTSGEQHALVQRQAASLHETSSTIQEIRQTSAVSASRAEIVLRVAGKAEDLGRSGQGAVDLSLEGLRGIRQQIGGIVAQIQNLAERTAAVGEIVESVQDLADQSNVLALNAAIEAARAGELGKGFGVVAREIRTLADQSIQSTGRIRSMIGEIQAAIRAAVGQTEQGNARMEEGLGQIRGSGENLQLMAGSWRRAVRPHGRSPPRSASRTPGSARSPRRSAPSATPWKRPWAGFVRSSRPLPSCRAPVRASPSWLRVCARPPRRSRAHAMGSDRSPLDPSYGDLWPIDRGRLARMGRRPRRTADRDPLDPYRGLLDPRFGLRAVTFELIDRVRVARTGRRAPRTADREPRTVRSGARIANRAPLIVRSVARTADREPLTASFEVRIQIVSLSRHVLTLVLWIVKLIPRCEKVSREIVSFSPCSLSFWVWSQRLEE